jgi:hypothetical protein
LEHVTTQNKVWGVFFFSNFLSRLAADELLTAEIDFSDQAITVQELPGHVRAAEITVTLDFLNYMWTKIEYIYTVFVGVLMVISLKIRNTRRSYNLLKCCIFILYL